MSDQPTDATGGTVDRRGRELAREAGEAYQRAVRHLAEDAANDGGATQAGDYVIWYAQLSAAGAYRPGEGGLEWVEPVAENCRLAVAVADAADGRFVPGLDVRAALVAGDEAVVGPVELPLTWHPGASHYGADVTAPGDGTYDLRVTVDPGAFPRRDRAGGDRYADPIEVTFADVDVACGQR